MSDYLSSLSKLSYTASTHSSRNSKTVMTFKRTQTNASRRVEDRLYDQRVGCGSRKLPPLSVREQNNTDAITSQFSRIGLSRDGHATGRKFSVDSHGASTLIPESVSSSSGGAIRKSVDAKALSGGTVPKASKGGHGTISRNTSLKTFSGLPLDPKPSVPQLKKKKSKLAVGGKGDEKGSHGSERSRPVERTPSNKSEWANIVHRLQIHKNIALKRAINGFKASSKSNGTDTGNAKYIATKVKISEHKPKKLTKRKTASTFSDQSVANGSADVSVQGKTMFIQDRIRQLKETIECGPASIDEDTYDAGFGKLSFRHDIKQSSNISGRELSRVNQVNIGDVLSIANFTGKKKPTTTGNSGLDQRAVRTKFKGAGNSVPAVHLTSSQTAAVSDTTTVSEERKRLSTVNSHVLAVENIRINTLLHRDKSPLQSVSLLDVNSLIPPVSAPSVSLSPSMVHTDVHPAVPVSQSLLGANLGAAHFGERRHGSPVPMLRDRDGSMSPVKDILIHVPRFTHLAPIVREPTPGHAIQMLPSPFPSASHTPNPSPTHDVSIFGQEPPQQSQPESDNDHKDGDDLIVVVTTSDGKLLDLGDHEYAENSQSDGRESGFVSLSSKASHADNVRSPVHSRLSTVTSSSSSFLEIPSVLMDSRARSPFSRTPSLSNLDGAGLSPDTRLTVPVRIPSSSQSFSPHNSLGVPKDHRTTSSLSLPTLDMGSPRRIAKEILSNNRSHLAVNGAPSTSLSPFVGSSVSVVDNSRSQSTSLSYLEVPHVGPESRNHSRLSIGSPIVGNLLSVPPQYLEPISGTSSALSMDESMFLAESRVTSRNSFASQAVVGDQFLSVSQNLNAFPSPRQSMQTTDPHAFSSLSLHSASMLSESPHPDGLTHTGPNKGDEILATHASGRGTIRLPPIDTEDRSPAASPGPRRRSSGQH